MKYTDLELAEIFLAAAPGMTPFWYEKLIDYFGDALETVRRASDDGLPIMGKHAAGVLRYLKDKDSFRAFLRLLREKQITCLTKSSEYYPELLRQIDDAPILLYARGRVDISFDKAVAVVGTRHETRYGEEVTRRIAGELAQSGVTIVSGLAVGIDAHAHAAALASGGVTAAVVAGGADNGIPSDNRALAEKILEHGVIYSEYPPGTPVRPWMFAPRNRIISGLAHGTLIVQAREKSGAMLTVDHAQEQGRCVFAVPGDITQGASYWPNKLIQQGAAVVLETADILDEFGWQHAASGERGAKQTLDLESYSPEEKLILLALGRGPLTHDTLCALTKLSRQSVMAHLTTLEMEGIIQQFPGRTVQLCEAYRP